MAPQRKIKSLLHSRRKNLVLRAWSRPVISGLFKILLLHLKCTNCKSFGAIQSARWRRRGSSSGKNLASAIIQRCLSWLAFHASTIISWSYFFTQCVPVVQGLYAEPSSHCTESPRTFAATITTYTVLEVLTLTLSCNGGGKAKVGSFVSSHQSI